MATRVAVQQNVFPRQSTGFRAEAVLLLVAAVAARFVAHYALPYFGLDPAYFKDFWPHRFPLILHIAPASDPFPQTDR